MALIQGQATNADRAAIIAAFPGYATMDPNAVVPDFNATGGIGKGPSQSSQDPQTSANNVIQSSLDTWQKLIQETSKKFKDYNAQNPFLVDDVLKQKHLEAKEQLDPYYNENLANYLLGTQRKLERGAQDTNDLLNELSGQTANYTQDAQIKLDNALQRAGEGYADTGLYDSGARMRSQGLLGTESGLQTEDFLRRQGYKTNQANLGLSRLQQDYGLGNLMGQNLRDINSLDLSNPRVGPIVATDIRNVQRERTGQEDILASQLTKEAGQKYVTGFNASLPPEFQGTNMDLLKQIGIYS